MVKNIFKKLLSHTHKKDADTIQECIPDSKGFLLFFPRKLLKDLMQVELTASWIRLSIQ